MKRNWDGANIYIYIYKSALRKVSAWMLTIAMIVSLANGLIVPAAAVDSEDLPDEGTLARYVLDHDMYNLDLGAWSTAAADGGAGHLQGAVCDDEGKYMYASFTNMLVKVDMATGEIVGTVKGMAAGSITNGAHIGCIAYYDGKIYGSLEYKAAERWYICVFDGEKIVGDMQYTDEGVMDALYVPQVGDDFKNELDAGEHDNSESSMGHRYGTGGIDGITFSKLPGGGYDTDGDGDVDVQANKTYMIVTYGPYGNAKRYDNDNFVFLVYDPEKITNANLLPFTETRLTEDVTDESGYFYEHKLFCYTGNQSYGAQQLEIDRDTGDWWVECYGKGDTTFGSHSRYLIDASVPLYLDEVEVGQSVTGDADGHVTKEAAIETAALYTDYEDGDSDGDKYEQEQGWHMTTKCICGLGSLNNHTETVYGATGHSCKFCGDYAEFRTGLISLGNDYFYGASSGTKTIDGTTYQTGSMQLYKLTRNANGTLSFARVTPQAKLLMSYTMDAADTYEDDNGQVWIKDVSGNGFDAMVEGTYAATGKNEKVGGALGFRGDEYGDVLDRVHMSDEAMTYINNNVEDTYTYSFWMYNEQMMDRFTPIIGMYKNEGDQENLYSGVFELRYANSPTLVANYGTDDPVIYQTVTGESYVARPGTGFGDGAFYIHGNGYSGESLYNKWVHYVVVRSGTTQTVYRDGVLASGSSGSCNDNCADDLLSGFEIGGHMDRNWIDSNVRQRYTGLIDDVRIYAGGVTASMVAEMYAAGPSDSDDTGNGAVASSAEREFSTYTGDILAEQHGPILALTSLDADGIVRDTAGSVKAEATKYVTATAGIDGSAGSALYFNGYSQAEPTKVSLNADDTAWLSTQLNATGKATISFWMNADMENSHRMSILGLYAKDGRPIATFETHGLLGQDVPMDGKFAIAFTSAKPSDDNVRKVENSLEQTAITNSETYNYTGGNSYGYSTQLNGHYGDKLIDTWYHVVGMLDQESGTMKLYVDGELVSTIEIAEATLEEIGYFMVGAPAGRYYDCEGTSDTSTALSGRQGWASRDGFLGAIDEIKVYNRTLSDEEIATLCEHTDSAVHSYVQTVVDPTCENFGYTVYECICGNYEIGNIVPALKHDYTGEAGSVTSPATCTTAGYTTYSCQRDGCGFSYVAEVSNPTGHTYNEGVVTEPTCTELGYTTYTCTASGCDHSYKDGYVAPTSHTYDTGLVTAPTCTELGYTTYTCTATSCGHSYNDNYVAAAGHTWGEGEIETAAGCASEGVMMYACAVEGCDATYQENIGATGHSFEATVVEPTCEHGGYTLNACTVDGCGFNYMSDLTCATGHRYTSEVTYPTCTEMGYTTYTCTAGDCDNEYKDDYVIPTEHSYNEGVVTEPTCTTMGYITYTCALNGCNHSYRDNYVSAAGHDYEVVVTAPTCVNQGYTTHTCTCGDTYTDAPVPATGVHAWDGGSVTTPATYTSKGVKTYTCTAEGCGATKTEEIPALESSGGSSSSSNVTSSKETNADGSTTTTTTNKTTGTITETTTTPEGVTGTTVTSKDGDLTEVSAKVPAAAADEAEKNGVAVTLPVEVTAADSCNDAVVIEVDVPAGGATVEIPVEDVTTGTVAVIVHADGTEEIVKTSAVSDTGVVVTLEQDATIKVIDNSKHFVDVHPVDHWAEGAIDFVVAREIYSGTGETTFHPDSAMSRGMLAVVLHRYEGSPEHDYDGSFLDLAEGSWYESSIYWAAGAGIIGGYGNGDYGPDDDITREQLAVMLWRYAGSPEVDHDLSHFVDEDEISDYAREALEWANANGVINGKSGNVLDPKSGATRAQVAQMLKNFITNETLN